MPVGDIIAEGLYIHGVTNAQCREIVQEMLASRAEPVPCATVSA